MGVLSPVEPIGWYLQTCERAGYRRIPDSEPCSPRRRWASIGTGAI